MWRRPFSTSFTLHLYLPSSSYYEDEVQEMEIGMELQNKEDVRYGFSYEGFMGVISYIHIIRKHLAICIVIMGCSSDNIFLVIAVLLPSLQK